MRHLRRCGVLVAELDAVRTRLRARMQVLNEEGTEICMEALLLLRRDDGVGRDILRLALVDAMAHAHGTARARNFIHDRDSLERAIWAELKNLRVLCRRLAVEISHEV